MRGRGRGQLEEGLLLNEELPQQPTTGRGWYIVAGLAGLGILGGAVYTGNWSNLSNAGCRIMLTALEVGAGTAVAVNAVGAWRAASNRSLPVRLGITTTVALATGVTAAGLFTISYYRDPNGGGSGPTVSNNVSATNSTTCFPGATHNAQASANMAVGAAAAVTAVAAGVGIICNPCRRQ